MKVEIKTNKLLYFRVEKTLNAVKCNKCKVELDYVEFFGEFNERGYVLAKCPVCGIGNLVVFQYYPLNKNKKKG